MEREGAAVTCDGRLFQRWSAATGNALSPTVDRRVRRTFVVTLFKKSLKKGFVVSNWIDMKFGSSVLQVNTHRLTKSDFRFDVKIASVTLFQTQKIAAICQESAKLADVWLSYHKSIKRVKKVTFFSETHMYVGRWRQTRRLSLPVARREKLSIGTDGRTCVMA